MPDLNVVLTSHQDKLVKQLVRSGRYQNADEVLGEGLRLIEQRDRMEAAKLQALQRAAEQGWADVAAGHHVDLDDGQLEDFVRKQGST